MQKDQNTFELEINDGNWENMWQRPVKDLGNFGCGRSILKVTSRLRGARDLYQKYISNGDTKIMWIFLMVLHG